jgi:hypothetical protein
LFYITGGVGILWFLSWTYFVSDDPTNHKFITSNEKEYILTHRRITCTGIGDKRPPYLKILMCPSVWILALCDFASSFGLYMVVIEGPSFINNVLKMDILQV